MFIIIIIIKKGYRINIMYTTYMIIYFFLSKISALSESNSQCEKWTFFQVLFDSFKLSWLILDYFKFLEL